MKLFKVQHRDTLWECKIEVNIDDPETISAIETMVTFWIDWEERLEKHSGDYVQTFVQQLAREIFYIKAETQYGIDGIVIEFKNREGWCAMDGSYGIIIKSVDRLYFEHWEFEVEEIEG